MTESISVHTRARGWLAALLAVALAVVGVVAGTAPAAHADSGSATASTLDWDFKSDWLGYVNAFGGSATPGDGASSSAGHSYWPAGVATYDPDATSGSVAFGGSFEYAVPAHGIDITIAGPSLEFESDGSAQLSWSPNGGAPVVAATGGAGSVVVGAPTSGDGSDTVTVTATGLVFTTDGAAAFSPGYTGGIDIVDPLTFTLSYAAAAPTGPVATTTTIASIDPADSAVEGTSVTVTAAVSPSDASGTVELHDGSASLGTEPSGTPFALTTLGVGTHSLWASFTPDDADAYQPSSSESSPSSYTITDSPLADVTVAAPS